MPPESNLWKWLRLGTRPLVKANLLHMCRVENAVGMGTPDVEGCFDSYGFHLELKAVPNRPKRSNTPVRVKFQPKQVPWLEKRWSVGGSAWVLLRVGERREIAHYLVPGNECHKLVKLPEDEIELISAIEPWDSAIQIIEKSVRSLDLGYGYDD